MNRTQTRDVSGEAGASSVEYGILISLIAAVIVIAVFAFGTAVGGLFSGSCQDMLAGGVETTTSTTC